MLTANTAIAITSPEIYSFMLIPIFPSFGRCICSIFGNALDNAIECEVKIPEKEKRLIHVTVSKQKQFLILRFENYCEETLQYQEGTPVTTKKEKEFHGYGLKSIQYTVNKYEGAVSVNLEDNWFELKVLIPIMQK